MSEPVTIEEARRAESRARVAADLVRGSELLQGPVPLPDFVSLLGTRIRWRRRVLALGAAGSLATVAMAVVMLFQETAPISYVVGGTVAISDGVIDASGMPGGASASLRFSEGTEVGLAPGARLRVVGRTSHGAALALDQGRARFAVAHRSGARWSVATGPFTVEVIGTKFTLDWSPSDERLVVDLTAGSVQVRGASVGGPVIMHPGERLIATAADRRVTLSPLVEAQAGTPGSADATTGADATRTAALGTAEVPAAMAMDRTMDRAMDRATDRAWAGEGGRVGAVAVGSPGGGSNPGMSPGRTSRRATRRAELALASPVREAASRPPSSSNAVRAMGASASGSGPSTSVVAPAPAVAPEPPQLDVSRAAAAPQPVFAPHPPAHLLTLGGGGAACAREAAQYRFERTEAGISVPDFYTLAFSSPRTDRSHSWCGQGSLRVDANFHETGRRNFFGRFANETGQVVVKLHRATDFTGKTVTVHFFVEGPPDAKFTAELSVVNRGRWVSGPPSGLLTTGRWLTITHRFEAENESGVPGSSNPGPFPEGGTSPVSSCDRLGLAIHSTGGRRVWTGAVYVDDVGWK